jgi:hypothetical protein
MSAAANKLHAALSALRWKDVTPEELVDIVIDPVTEALKQITARVTALERADAQRVYRGVYSTTEKYFKHNSCTHSGSLWIATADPTGSPPGNAWILAVRRGRDADR